MLSTIRLHPPASLIDVESESGRTTLNSKSLHLAAERSQVDLSFHRVSRVAKRGKTDRAALVGEPVRSVCYRQQAVMVGGSSVEA